MLPDKARILELLRGWVDPILGMDYVTARMVGPIEVLPETIRVDIELGYPSADRAETIANDLGAYLREATGLPTISVQVSSKILSHAVQKNLKPLHGIRNIIAVASGKGGVGKSTTSINLAVALTAQGARVGLLDADIYGPSIPHMLGLSGRPEIKDGNQMEPREAYGLKVMSIGFLVDDDQAVIWRGPMVTGALQQLLNQTAWGDLDYLVIDLPPGTGDVQLSLAQQIPVSGAVIVTTPQDIALLDAQRGLQMFRKVGIPVLGIIENMSVHICSNCGHQEPLFGAGGGSRMAEQHQTELLGELPLNISIREQADSGKPFYLSHADHPAATAYQDIASRMSARLALLARDYSSRFPTISVVND